jgi:hypothetical protein
MRILGWLEYTLSLQGKTVSQLHPGHVATGRQWVARQVVLAAKIDGKMCQKTSYPPQLIGHIQSRVPFSFQWYLYHPTTWARS